jgi:hypothetical protein
LSSPTAASDPRIEDPTSSILLTSPFIPPLVSLGVQEFIVLHSILKNLSLFALVIGFAGTASADPGKGFRWSDHAWGNSSRTQTARSAPAAVYSPAATPSSSTAGTIAVRGPDGVVRNYPVEGGATVQRQTGLPGQATQTVTVRGPDGVVRTYQIAPSEPAASAVPRCN